MTQIFFTYFLSTSGDIECVKRVRGGCNIAWKEGCHLFFFDTNEITALYSHCKTQIFSLLYKRKFNNFKKKLCYILRFGDALMK